MVPHKLWLNVGASVILLRNLSDKLLNGLFAQTPAVLQFTANADLERYFTHCRLKINTKKTKIMISERDVTQSFFLVISLTSLILLNILGFIFMKMDRFTEHKSSYQKQQ